MSTNVVFLVSVCLVFVVDAAPQDLGSPIRIAQCRALCLNKVSNRASLNLLGES